MIRANYFKMNVKGKILGIATRKKTKAVMDEHSSAAITFENGVGQDSRGKKRNNRQVTIVTNENWHSTCKELGSEIPWTTRRANILIEGIELKEMKGSQLKIGTAIVEITGELEPCNRMDEQYQGLTDILTPDWRGGVTCKLIQEGEIHLNDEVELITK